MPETTNARHRPSPKAVAAGLVYFAIVFAIGFALGTLRELIVIPRFGNRVTAVIVELPIMLALSWITSRQLVARFNVPPLFRARLMMGGLAFTLLMIAELSVSVFGFGRTFSAHWEQYWQLPAFLGLVAQIAFATFPVAQSLTGSASGSARGTP
jgi:hypothetical protein